MSLSPPGKLEDMIPDTGASTLAINLTSIASFLKKKKKEYNFIRHTITAKFGISLTETYKARERSKLSH